MTSILLWLYDKHPSMAVWQTPIYGSMTSTHFRAKLFMIYLFHFLVNDTKDLYRTWFQARFFYCPSPHYQVFSFIELPADWRHLLSWGCVQPNFLLWWSQWIYLVHTFPRILYLKCGAVYPYHNTHKIKTVKELNPPLLNVSMEIKIFLFLLLNHFVKH